MINPATGEFITEFGPLASAEIILLDEINRIPLKSQSAFLEGLQDRTVTVGKTTYEMAPFSFAIATMNPVELGQGTFPLSEAATDRFAIMINIAYLAPLEEEKLVNFDFKRVRLKALIPKERIIELRSVITREVFLHDALAKYIRRSSRSAWTSVRRRARRSAGAESSRCGRCCCIAARRCFRKTFRIWRGTSSAIACGSGRMPPVTACPSRW